MPAAIARVPCGRRLSQPTASCSTQACRRTHMPRRTLFCLFACFAASCVPLVGAPTPVARVCTLFQLGVLVADIASHFDITPRRVNQILREGGLRAALPPKPSHAVLDRIIAAETARFGPNYGFAMLHGALTQLYPQWRFTRREVYASLRRIAPGALRSRRDFAQYRLRRGHYHAPHFGYSCHLDLACKLQEYGLYVGARADGTHQPFTCAVHLHRVRAQAQPSTAVLGCAPRCAR